MEEQASQMGPIECILEEYIICENWPLSFFDGHMAILLQIDFVPNNTESDITP